MNGQEVGRVSTMKYLGLFIDENLSFELHVKSVCTSICQKLGAIRKSRRWFDTTTSLILYESWILPVIDYCDVIYMTTTKRPLQKLQFLQKHKLPYHIDSWEIWLYGWDAQNTKFSQIRT